MAVALVSLFLFLSLSLQPVSPLQKSSSPRSDKPSRDTRSSFSSSSSACFFPSNPSIARQQALPLPSYYPAPADFTLLAMPRSGGFSSSSKASPAPQTATQDDSSNNDNNNRRSTGICDSILDVIGDTPLVRLNRIIQTSSNNNDGPSCQILVKCEFFNAGGSVKDRIGRQMVLDAEKSGIIQPGITTLIEPTSGNTGIGLALAAAIKGYRCIITMPEKMSKEKVDVLKALGAEIVRTPTEAAWDAPESHISVARRLQQEIPNAHILDQYANPSNPNAHYQYTAEEILRQTNGKVDMLVAGAGTGGTITGIARRLKEANPNVIIVGVDPEGSILAVPDSLNDKCRLESYQVEGIGYDFIPQVLDRNLVDVWYKSNDRESLLTMRRLIRDEGLLCGGSSGAAVSCALRAARDYHLRPDQNCVVILPDSVRNYMTKALSDDWMADHGMVDGDVVQAKQYPAWWANRKVYELPLSIPLTITSTVICKDAIALLKREGYDMVPVLDEAGAVIGVVTEGNITQRLLSGRCRPTATVADAGVIYKTFHKFTMNDTLASLAQALDHDPFVLIVTEQRCFSGPSHRHHHATKRPRLSSDAGDPTASVTESGAGDDDDEGASTTSKSPSPAPTAPSAAGTGSKLVTRTVVSGIVSRIDLLDFISHHDETDGAGAVPSNSGHNHNNIDNNKNNKNNNTSADH